MVREIQAIPPALRRVRWRAVLWHHWLLVVVGASLCVYGGAFTWMLFLAAGGKASDNAALDAGPVATAAGTVVEVGDAPLTSDDGAHDLVVYRFPEFAADATCFVPSGSVQVGAPVEVEYLPERSYLSRIRGGRLDLMRWWLRPRPWLYGVVLPGVPLLLLWLIAVLRLRHMMARGDVAVAAVTDCRRVRFLVPGMLAIRFRFRDHRAAERTGGHWVHWRSPLGERLRRFERGDRVQVPVLHSRRWPQFSRLALPADFAPFSPSASNQETMRS